jgi:hypothetical protein
VRHRYPQYEASADHIGSLIESITSESRHLSQRSESLDERWREGWGRLQERLMELRSALVAHESRSGQTA